MRLSIFAFLLVLFCESLYSQKVTLQVLEKGTEQPIVGANIVYADNKRLENPNYAVSDIDGKAILQLKKQVRYYYKVSFVGFIPSLGVIPTKAKTLPVHLEEDVVHMNEVVVTGSRTARPIRLSPVSTQVLGGKELVNSGYSNLQQALQQETPGLNIQKVGFGNEISMQGLDARHVLFLMDGERMTGDMAGNLDYERFNIHALDRIEIVKGASSTLYGSRAAGAVINLITKKTTRPIDIQAGVRYAQMNEVNYKNISRKDFLYMFEKNADRPNLQAWISAGFNKNIFTSQTDVWYSSSDAFYMYQKTADEKVYTKEANPFLSHDVIIKSRAMRPPMGIEGSEHLSASQKLYIEPLNGFTALVYGNTFIMNTYDMIQDLTFTQTRDWAVGGKLSYRVKDWFTIIGSMHTDIYRRQKRHERIDTAIVVYKSSIVQPRFSIRSNYFDGHSLIAGVENVSDDLTSDRFDGNSRMTSRSLSETEYFAQDEWTINPRWMCSSGIRTNFSDVYGFMAMPKIAVKYTPNDNWTFRANYSMGYRSPSIKELFFNWDHLGMFRIKGNDKLIPERNNYYSLSAEFSNKNFFINTTIYGNYFRDKIEGVWRVYDLQYNFEYTNLSKQRILGVESLIRWHFLDSFTFNGSFSYVDVSKTNGLQINNTSPLAITGSLDYKFNTRNYRLNCILSSSFMGSKSFDVQDRITIKGISKKAYYRTNLPSYLLCNLTLSQEFYNKVKLTLGLNNLLNYQPEILGSGVTMFNVPATPGRRAYVQLEFLVDNIVNSIIRK